MANKRKHYGDPRKAGGSIAGPGGPQDKNAVIIDPTHAVLLDHVDVALMEPYREGQAGSPAIAMSLAGRINKTDDRTEILYLFDEDGAAAICTELITLASRIGPEFLERTLERLDKIRDAGGIGTVG